MLYRMVTLSISIPDELKRQLDELGERQQRPTSELVQESLRRYIVAEQLRVLRHRTAPLAEALGYRTDEDVFRDVS